VEGILRSIYAERKTLNEITPRQLEEIVAELLRSQGMDIYVTPQTRDGGRDIIARGELVPGEPTILAVEVKHRKVVGMADLYGSLKANENFPALLLVTTGRFSGGVVNEKTKSENRLRLLLKDGVALSQWICAYGARRFR
jgi:predicted Mrr-cat superfamily restriction endonuclease